MSTAIRVPVNGPSRRTRSDIASLLDEVGGPLGDRHDRGVAVARRYRRHDTRVDHPHPGDAPDPQLRIDGRQVVDAHPARPGLVVVAVRALADEPDDVL